MPAQPQIIVDELPPCDLCAKVTSRTPGAPVPLAQFQGLSTDGEPLRGRPPGSYLVGFASMCWPHFVSHGLGLGPGKGFRLVVRCQHCTELLWPWRFSGGRYGWSHSGKVQRVSCRRPRTDTTNTKAEPKGWDASLQQASLSDTVKP